jgi:hypothetical protein
MSKENESYIRYVVITTRGYWGKDPELKVALKNANVNAIYALNSKKKSAVAHVYRVELDPVYSIFNEESRKGLKANHISFSGYEEGDLIEPWVNDWGNLGTWGAKSSEKVIELKIK